MNQRDPMEERRLLLAVALSLLVLTAYQWMYPPAPRKTPPSPAATAEQVAESPAAPAPAASPGTEATPIATPAPSAPPEPPIADERERRVEIRAQDFDVAFTNRGARLISWRLHRYVREGRPEEMVEIVGQEAPRPLDLRTGRADLDQKLTEALFLPSAEATTVTEAGGRIEFRYREGGLEAVKSLAFREEGLAQVTASVRWQGQELPVQVAWGPGVGNPSDEERAVRGYVEPRAVLLHARSLERVAAAELSEPRQMSGLRAAGIESRYFAALWLGQDLSGSIRTARTRTGEEGRVLPVVWAQSGPGGLELFVGAKDYDRLAHLGRGIERVVEVGDWIGPIVVPVMRLLRWVHTWVGSYGAAIILVTLFINLVMAPLRHYSIANGIRMARLSPEMKAIQDRYRKIPMLDPRRQQMQEEIAALYARHGMNMSTQMLVGCLPLMLTMPFLFAIYRVLDISIDLRGATFLWMPDLSQKDPYFVTPILMGVSMIVMQRTMPSTMDAAQQRVMMIMPLVLVVMFFAAPAGLNLYWLASNLCSIVQQLVTLRLVGGAEKGIRKT